MDDIHKVLSAIRLNRIVAIQNNISKYNITRLEAIIMSFAGLNTWDYFKTFQIFELLLEFPRLWIAIYFKTAQKKPMQIDGFGGHTH